MGLRMAASLAGLPSPPTALCSGSCLRGGASIPSEPILGGDAEPEGNPGLEGRTEPSPLAAGHGRHLAAESRQRSAAERRGFAPGEALRTFPAVVRKAVRSWEPSIGFQTFLTVMHSKKSSHITIVSGNPPCTA